MPRICFQKKVDDLKAVALKTAIKPKVHKKATQTRITPTGLNVACGDPAEAVGFMAALDVIAK